MLTLKDTPSFAQGDLRKCYIHPQDPNLCIKVQKKDALANQNAIEKWYLAILKLRKANYQNILPAFKGVVKTDIGEGLVYELVIDNDGNCSRSASDYIKEGILTIKQVEELIHRLCDALTKQSILLDDKNPENILLKLESKDCFTPILIDGFGAKRFGIKFFIGAFVPFYSRYKTKKRCKEMIAKIYKELG